MATTGWVDIESVGYSSTDQLTWLSMTFELRCQGSTAALRGLVHWRADEQMQITGPVVPPPAGLWAPAPGATPAQGNYVYLESEPGDPVGGGQTRTLTATATEPLHINAGVSLTVQQYLEGGSWEGRFQPMSSISELQPGYYPNLKGTSAIWGLNQLLGGMYFKGAASCEHVEDPAISNPYRGWFVIDSITRVNGVVQSIDARFEQRCQGQTAALRGKIHWSAN